MSRRDKERRPKTVRPPGQGGARSTARGRVDGSFLILLLCFLFSGFAALLYETVWTRQFTLVFGTSELAVATVLAAYMGGLAAGAAVAGRFASRLERPVYIYGILEIGIALAALAVPSAIRASTALCVALFGGGTAPPEAGGMGFALFYLVCSFAILLVPTGLMGATLPLLARATVHRQQEIGPRVGVLYATNTLGAVLGTLVAAFVLLPRLGQRSTVLVGALVNALVCAAAALLARSTPAASSTAPSTPTGASAGAVPLAAAFDRSTFILPIMLVSGVASFSFEVLWTRLLGHILGGSVYAFATMLASFLTGIVLGSGVAARLASTPSRAAFGFALAQLGTAALSYLAFQSADSLPGFAVWMGAGGSAGLAPNAIVAGLALLPAAFCIGTTFPFAVRILALRDADAGQASARVYAWNTVGAILGAIGSGFFLIPLLGYAGMLAAAVALNLLLAMAVALLMRPRSRPLALAAVAGLAVLVIARPATPWKLVSTVALSLKTQAQKPQYFAVGRSATVALTEEGNAWKMRINGLPEGMILPANQNQASVLERWLGALPVLARPDTRSMLVIGLGGGSALETISTTVESVDVIELEPKVVEANRLLSGRRAVDPLVDPRIHLHVNDARGALMLTAKRYDAIVSQPSHPWTAGASHLYTREFFALVHEHLTPGGVFVQWIELAFLDHPLLQSLVATLLEVFPNVRLYRPVFRSGLLFVSSDQPLPVESEAVRAIASSPKTFAWANIQTPEDVAAALALDEEGARRLARGGVITTDDQNLLQSRSPTILAAPLGTAGGDRILGPLDPLPEVSRNLKRLYLIRRLLADNYRARAERLVTALDPVEKLVAGGLIYAAAGRIDDAKATLREALRLAPQSYEARVALLRLEHASLLAGTPEVMALAEPLRSHPMAALIEAWRAAAAGDWARVQALDDRLSGISPDDAIYADTLRLRAVWRIESGTPALALEALAMMDRVIVMSAHDADRQLRARALAIAGGFPSLPSTPTGS